MELDVGSCSTPAMSSSLEEIPAQDDKADAKVIM